MDRFDKFLYKNLKEYIQMELILEVIITDENGNDVEKIKSSDLDLSKIKLFVNETRLGPFLNKLTCCKKSSNEWIVLMDSDNFAPKEYFETAKKYIEKNNLEGNHILAPSQAMPNFDYRKSKGMIYKKGNFKSNRIIERKKRISDIETCMNTGNYVLNKNIIEILNLDNEQENIKKFSPYDVIYFNTLVFEQTDTQFHIVKDLHYIHVVHDGSIWIKTHKQFVEFNNHVHKRYRSLE